MAGSPYRTPPNEPARLAPRQADDSALPLVALAIVFAALAPPLAFGVLSICLGLH